jgi:hypothetical protein
MVREGADHPISMLFAHRRKRDFTKTTDQAVVVRGPHLSYVSRSTRPRTCTTLSVWARRHLQLVPISRGPALEPRTPRTAIAIVDDPLDHGNFEGTIPQVEYFSGKVLIWDPRLVGISGQPSGNGALAWDHLEFIMEAEDLHGAPTLKRHCDRDESNICKS